jgi:hypothetical protein
VGSARGAFINLSGNEAGGSGQVHIGAGAGGLSRIVFSTFAGGDQIRGYIHPSGGFSWGTATDPGNTSMTIAGNLTVSSALLVNGPTNLTTLNVNAAGGNVSWGQYTPTLTPVSNLDGAVVAHGPWQFLRIGNNVFISGTALADPTAAGGTGTSFNFTLPIATNPLAQGDLSGVVSSVADNGIVQPLGAGGVPQAVWFSQITTQSAYCVVAQYRIV